MNSSATVVILLSPAVVSDSLSGRMRQNTRIFPFRSSSWLCSCLRCRRLAFSSFSYSMFDFFRFSSIAVDFASFAFSSEVSPVCFLRSFNSSWPFSTSSAFAASSFAYYSFASSRVFSFSICAARLASSSGFKRSCSAIPAYSSFILMFEMLSVFSIVPTCERKESNGS